MAAAEIKYVNVENIARSDVWVDNGRRLKAPVFENNKRVKRGDIAKVTEDVAKVVVDAGLCEITTAKPTVD